MKNDKALIGIAEKLEEDPSEKNWKLFSKALKSSSVTNYRVVYQQGSLKTLKDLKKSFAELYAPKHKYVTKIPIFKNVKEGVITGTTIYLKDLLIINKV